MSTDYGPYCLDCRTGYVIDNERRPANVRDLIAAMKGAAPALARMPEGYSLTRGWGAEGVDVGWFAAHDGHDVVVWDEYGGRDPRCFVEYKCSCCLTSFRCMLVKDHDGPHSKNIG